MELAYEDLETTQGGPWRGGSGLTSTSQMPALKVIIGVMEAIVCVFVMQSSKDQVQEWWRDELDSFPKDGGGVCLGLGLDRHKNEVDVVGSSA